MRFELKGDYAVLRVEKESGVDRLFGILPTSVPFPWLRAEEEEIERAWAEGAAR